MDESVDRPFQGRLEHTDVLTVATWTAAAALELLPAKAVDLPEADIWEAAEEVAGVAVPTDDVTACVAVETDLVLSDATGWLLLLLPFFEAAGIEEEEEVLEVEEGVEDVEALELCLVALLVVALVVPWDGDASILEDCFSSGSVCVYDEVCFCLQSKQSNVRWF